MRNTKKKRLAALLLATGLGIISIGNINSFAEEPETESNEEIETQSQEEVVDEEIEILSDIETESANEEIILDDEQEIISNQDRYSIIESQESERENEILKNGTCGLNNDFICWELKENGILQIQGVGEMNSWEREEQVPWYEIRYDITEIKIMEGVTSIGNYAFSHCENVTKIELADSIKKIGSYAFFKCGRLSTISIG